MNKPTIYLQSYELADPNLLTQYFPGHSIPGNQNFTVEIPLSEYALIRQADAAFRQGLYYQSRLEEFYLKQSAKQEKKT